MLINQLLIKNKTICIYKERKGNPTEENQQRVSSFFSKQTCLKNE